MENEQITSDITLSELDALVESAMETGVEELEILPDNTDILKTEDNVSRFQGAMWFDEMRKQDVCIAGLGGIGSWTALLISRLDIGHLLLVDPDSVEAVNMAGQFYSTDNISAEKGLAIRCNIQGFSRYFRSSCIKDRIENIGLYSPVLICGFDNMEARRTAFLKWKTEVEIASHCRKDYLYIDGRLDAEDFQIFCIQGDDAYHIEKYYNEYLFTDSKVDEAPCSFKQTSYLANMIGSYITNLFVNFVANRVVEYSKVLPFKTSFNTSTLTLKLEEE